MNQPIPTGPDRFGFAETDHDKARQYEYGHPKEAYHRQAAQFHATQAHTAALVMLTEVIANATGTDHHDLDAWREKIGLTWLKECRSKNERRPQCAERHTDDCAYVDPVPEPKHVLLPVGTRVLVSEKMIKQLDGTITYPGQPWVGKIHGYDTGRTKYRIWPQTELDTYSAVERWAFADNRVQPHPEQDDTAHTCPGRWGGPDCTCFNTKKS
jgi:hypothetical protein